MAQGYQAATVCSAARLPHGPPGREGLSSQSAHDGVAFMQLGFETVGNATLIAWDGRPVLATDPWIVGTAYFGSWGLSHTIPAAQLEAIRNADFLWFSHGHPDHLNADSLAQL